MELEPRTVLQLLVRALSGTGFVFVVLCVILSAPLGTTGGAEPAGPGVRGGWSETAAPIWDRGFARQFPGCVDVRRWRAALPPQRVVVVKRAGTVGEMGYDEAWRRSTSTTPADDVWTVGACR